VIIIGSNIYSFKIIKTIYYTNRNNDNNNGKKIIILKIVLIA